MRSFLITLCFAASLARAETFDAKKASFFELFEQSQGAPDTPQHAAWREAAYAELLARGPETLSNLMERIHVENVMIGVYAINMTKDTPIPKEQALPVLMSFTTAERPVTRKMAAFLASFYRAPEFAEKMFPLLSHEKTKGAAIRALGKWQVTNSLPHIAPFLHDDKERVRVVTANALRDIGDPAAIEPLIEALSDPMFSVRNTAARALVSFGPRSVQPLIDAMKRTPSAAARRQIIRCLGDLKDKRAESALRPLTNAGDLEVRNDAQRSLDFIAEKISEPWFGPGGE